MALIFEDESKTIGKKQFIVPDKVVGKLKLNRDLFGNAKKSKGYKRINAIIDDDYNKRSNKKDKIHNGKKTISGSELKKLNQEKDSGQISNSPTDINNVLTGPLFPWAKDQLRAARTAVEKVKAVPPVPKLEKHPEKPEDVNKPLKMGNASVKITENIEYFYDEYLSEYGATYVFDSFLSHPEGRQNWGTLINPDMYSKALAEFTKYGKLVHFPEKYIYQWLGIIMKNTSILMANTEICGHDMSFPYDEFEEFINKYYNDGREIIVKYNKPVIIELSENEVLQKCEKYTDEFSNIEDLINEYNSEHNREYNTNKIYFNSEKGKYFWKIEIFEFEYEIGLTGEWMSMPDGSDAISDYGIEPIVKILAEYEEGMPAEKVLVIVNKALDIWHCRGDLSSIFVQGGISALDKIAEELKRNKKIMVNENQLLVLKNILKNIYK